MCNSPERAQCVLRGWCCCVCRLDDVTRPLYFRGNRLSLMFRVGRDGVLLLSGIGKGIVLDMAFQ